MEASSKPSRFEDAYDWSLGAVVFTSLLSWKQHAQNTTFS